MPPEPPVGSPQPQLLHIEFRFNWLIEIARLEKATPDRRLNAIENLLTVLCRRWRGTAMLAPGRDVRLSARTSHALAEWVQLRRPAAGLAGERLLSITTGGVVDEAVPDGWLRVLLQDAAP